MIFVLITSWNDNILITSWNDNILGTLGSIKYIRKSDFTFVAVATTAFCITHVAPAGGRCHSGG